MEYYDKRDILAAIEEQGDETRRDINSGFNRVAAALDKLTAELKGLRSDINPEPLEKTAKLVPPKQGTAL